MRRIISAILLPFVFNACAFNDTGNESDPNRRRQLEERQKLVENYLELQGMYEGTYTRPSGSQPVRFMFSYREKVVGSNRDGEPIFQPILLVKMDRYTTTEEDVRFQGSFTRENGDLTLTTQTTTQDAVCDGECLYLRGVWQNGHFSGPVRSRGGIELGTINISRVTTKVDEPSNGEVLDEYEELRARLEKFVGHYIGEAIRPNRKDLEVKIDFTLSIIDGPRNSNPKYPRLVSNSFWTSGSSTVGTHSVTYINDRGQEELIFAPVEGSSGFNLWSMTSVWKNNKIEGSIRIPKNGQRVFKAKRID